jgi:2-keto-4-pentenoate hydratase/2-oxohepta-3-ene-1,7-dioic acid hydratase in catechol pathway
MKLYTTTEGIARSVGDDLELLDLPFGDIGDLIRAGALADAASARCTAVVPISAATLAAPIRRPGKLPIIGLNYRSHAEEVIEALRAFGKNAEMPTEPNMHLTPGSAVIGPEDSIVLPSVAADKVDYEGEIAVVIGSTACRVPVEEAWSCVAGLTICNDVSARDVQQRAMFGDSTVSIAGAKSFDTFKPLGPCLVTADEFSEPLDLHLRTWVNGELRQDASTTEFMYQISELIAWVSQRMTLEPGDVLATGSPQGVGPFAPDGGVFLRPGDVVEIEVERIGRLRNSVVAAD